MSVSVATMNYQDYAALQNSLNSYLQSSADNEEVTLPSNLTMENINAAIQSEGSHYFVCEIICYLWNNHYLYMYS